MSRWCDQCGNDCTGTRCDDCRRDEARDTALALLDDDSDAEVLDDCG